MMTLRSLGALIGIAACLAAPGAVAAEQPAAPQVASIGEQTVELTAPDNGCFARLQNPSDAQLIATIQKTLGTTNRLLGTFADCAELARWRTGSGALLDHHGQYQTLTKFEGRRIGVPRDAFVRQVCAQYTQNKVDIGAIFEQSRERVEKNLAAVKVNQQKFLGVLEVSPDGCFTALVQKFRTQAGTDKTQIGIIATTLARGKIVYIYLYAPEAGVDAFKAQLQDTKDLVRSFLAANSAR